MAKILIPMDGSQHALRALDQVLQRPDRDALDIHLLNVQLPVDGNVRTFISAQDLEIYHREEGMAALREALQKLDAAGVRSQHHILTGHPGDVISRFAQQGDFDEIVMGTHGRTGLVKLVMGSVASEVSAKTGAKVTLIK